MTSAKLVPMRPRALRFDPTVTDPVAAHYRMVEQIYRRKDQFDVIHSHLDYFPLALLTRQHVPFVTTLHGRLDLDDYIEIFSTFRDAPFVSISDSQRAPVPHLNWVRTVRHGVPEQLLTPLEMKRDYPAFLGRISPEKRVDRAIRVAGRVGMKLKIAAKVDKVDRPYFAARSNR